jgi:UbiD family decarboxylase
MSSQRSRESYDGLREWLDAVDDIGELMQVSGADVETEIPGITEMYQRNPGTEALLFDDIPGYPSGYRVHTCLLSSPGRLAMMMDMDQSDASLAEITELIRERVRDIDYLDPVVRDDGPIFENVDEGTDVDVTKFPVPTWHERDGGPFIGTADLVVTKNPAGDWVNVGTYRSQVFSENEVGMLALQSKHGREHLDAWHDQGEAAPIAIVCGFNPELYWGSGIEVPRGKCEYDYVGWWRGEPVELVESELTGLPIPAHSEIVLEGHIQPDKTEMEGPFGEWLGYYGGEVAPTMVVDVERVMHRDDPILNGSPPSKPPCEETYYRSPLRAAYIWNQLSEDLGVPGIEGVACDPAGGSRLWTVVSIDQQYAGHATQVAQLAQQVPAGAYMNRFVVVVDEDIDPWDRSEVIWALSTRCHPPRDVNVVDRTLGDRLDSVRGIPWNEDLGREDSRFNGRAYIDATRSWENLENYPPVAAISDERQAQILEDWPELFEHFDP